MVIRKCKEMGLNIKDLESDQKLQDRVLSIHHIYSHTLNSTAAFKIIENNLGTAYIQQAQKLLVQTPGVQRGQLQVGEPITPATPAIPESGAPQEKPTAVLTRPPTLAGELGR
ncbi:hypothetical protein JWG42_10440 [Desulfoprunum benzoelyticum]|uniref:hypothetical protein n=1 Tax=Desulfoprunum benzoelyticum TaxID=1506996 RepID=UPI001964B824|nr:hypothetical protein [Desulfoprunum benzoelyticum]MBM9530565.1 hypothetical protein [Desulfoprunum benzoelyticum]